MRLKAIKDHLNCVAPGFEDVEVRDVTYDSRKVAGDGVIFAAIAGEHADGHNFVASAVNRGAVCVLAERYSEGVNVPQLIVSDVREALASVSEKIYGTPAGKLVMTGVTGTNGKTTTSFLIESVLAAAGHFSGVIGTVNYRYGGETFSAPHTTPEAPDLHALLSRMVSSAVTHCVMEVSSHALAQKRVNGCSFDVAVFTNLTSEHLDYHRTMDEYFTAKSLLFKRLLRPSSGRAVINLDDEWGVRLAGEVPGALTYSLKEGADVYPESFSLKAEGIDAEIVTPQGRFAVSSSLVGEYNLQNILAATGAAAALGIDLHLVARGISALERVPGRLEKIESGGPKRFRAYVDYAHTGDALRRSLDALKKVAEGRIITVFGCGGDRDRSKRPEMGGISARLSDVTIITSDNPRSEDPLKIIAEIEAGLSGVRKFDSSMDAANGEKGYLVIPERREAIRAAIRVARDNDTILVAGKGHEDYQIINGVKHHFDDFETLREAISLASSGL